MFLKGFTTTLAAIAISFAGLSATPAQAGNDTAKIIAGAAALAIIGAAIADSRNNRRYVSRHHGYNYHNPYYYGHNYHGHKRKVYRHHYYKKHNYRHKHHRKHW
ncbi:MAG: hypothetical protein AAGB07_09395 [Pseudomonadota bacterium]